MTQHKIEAVSFTGADDSVDPAELVRVSARWPQVEWAILINDESTGGGRTPSSSWRKYFLSHMEGFGHSAAHLCGVKAFERVLAEGVWPELARYGRVQANINSKSTHFDKAQIFEVWHRLSTGSGGLIIQWHENVQAWAAEFLAQADANARVEVLFDESKGCGQSPKIWHESHPGRACGYAGGLSPENVETALKDISAAVRGPGCWIDMETGVRTHDHFDVKKCVEVLERARPWLR